MRRVRDLQPYVGKEIEAKIIELDKNRNNVVLSRRAWLEQTQSEVRSEFLNQLQKGQVRKGVVSSIVNFGAFVDLGGVDGLVHVSELSWKHIDHPSEVVEVGNEVTVEVLDVDLDRERVSLSLKATQEDPWRQFARTHAIGQIVPGKVTKLVPFGAFVRVEEGIEGLVHISELAERHVEVPDQVVAVGDDAMVKVIDIDLERRRISLSLKQANEDYHAEFDPSKYGMADSYDEQGNYIFPEGFDPETNEWLEGYEKQRDEWETRYAEAERRHKMHTAQMEKMAADEAAEASAAANYSSGGGEGAPSASRRVDRRGIARQRRPARRAAREAVGQRLTRAPRTRRMARSERTEPSFLSLFSGCHRSRHPLRPGTGDGAAAHRGEAVPRRVQQRAEPVATVCRERLGHRRDADAVHPTGRAEAVPTAVSSPAAHAKSLFRRWPTRGRIERIGPRRRPVGFDRCQARRVGMQD